MPIYNCEKCGYTASQKRHIEQHINRKTPCDMSLKKLNADHNNKITATRVKQKPRKQEPHTSEEEPHTSKEEPPTSEEDKPLEKNTDEYILDMIGQLVPNDYENVADFIGVYINNTLTEEQRLNFIEILMNETEGINEE